MNDKEEEWDGDGEKEKLEGFRNLSQNSIYKGRKKWERKLGIGEEETKNEEKKQG